MFNVQNPKLLPTLDFGHQTYNLIVQYRPYILKRFEERVLIYTATPPTSAVDAGSPQCCFRYDARGGEILSGNIQDKK